VKPTIIYALIDPLTGEIRYVGKTISTPSQRLAVHLYYARKNHRTGCARWLKRLSDVGLRPEIYVLQTAHEDWQEVERFWIAKLRQDGVSLLNHTAGGDGLNEYSHTETARANMRESQRLRYATNPSPLKGRARPVEVVEKCRAANLGRNISAEARSNMSKAAKGRIITDDARKKISAALKGRPKPPRTLEHCAKIAAKAKGRKWSDEAKARHSDGRRAYANTPDGKLHMRKAGRAGRAAQVAVGLNPF
jgi:hypothetical protein